MDFKKATDELFEQIDHEELAKALARIMQRFDGYAARGGAIA